MHAYVYKTPWSIYFILLSVFCTMKPKHCVVRKIINVLSLQHIIEEQKVVCSIYCMVMHGNETLVQNVQNVLNITFVCTHMYEWMCKYMCVCVCILYTFDMCVHLVHIWYVCACVCVRVCVCVSSCTHMICACEWFILCGICKSIFVLGKAIMKGIQRHENHIEGRGRGKMKRQTTE